MPLVAVDVRWESYDAVKCSARTEEKDCMGLRVPGSVLYLEVDGAHRSDDDEREVVTSGENSGIVCPDLHSFVSY